MMTEIAKATRLHAVSWWGSVLGLGILLGALGYHFLEIRKFDDIQTQLNTIQQQMTPAAPIPKLSIPGGERNTGSWPSGLQESFGTRGEAMDLPRTRLERG